MEALKNQSKKRLLLVQSATSSLQLQADGNAKTQASAKRTGRYFAGAVDFFLLN